jgi:DEAD/DEAH box helicase domain-containing protein
VSTQVPVLTEVLIGQRERSRPPLPGSSCDPTTQATLFTMSGGEQSGAERRPASAAVDPAAGDADRLLAALHASPGRRDRLVHVHRRPARAAVHAAWPSWLAPSVRSACERAGVPAPYAHQVALAELAHAGRSAVVATGTASGKTLAYLLPTLSALVEGTSAPNGRGATALYLSPTKALAHDQLRAVTELGVEGVRAAAVDGDTPMDERDWARNHAALVLTNPDLLHRSMLPGHPRWASFLRALRFVVIDESHVYRGVFGSHVAHVLRRLRRVCARYGADPVFLLASATAADPGRSASTLVGLDVAEVVDDGAPRPTTVFGFWEPPLTGHGGEHDAPVRRSVLAETADLLADLVAQDVRTLAFVRSRRGSEVVAATARDLLEEVEPGLGDEVAAYRGGYLPEERRALERALRTGALRGLATTNALELGMDVSGLDAVLLAGWPDTRASLWQQAGRAGRADRDALAVLVARDDPLDTYVVHHPESVFGKPVEATVLDPSNPVVLGPHLCASAAEVPLTPADLATFGDPAAVEAVLDELVAEGRLRRRPGGWFWTSRERACDLADIRGGGATVSVIEEGTGRVLGTVDHASAPRTVHAGAVYVHQGRTHVVDTLDLESGVAAAHVEEPPYSTQAREVSDIRVVDELRSVAWGPARVVHGTVDVSSQVVSFLRRRTGSGEVLGEEPLDSPVRTLRTRATWWTLPTDELDRAGVDTAELPGALHAAEHASIGLLPLLATCDRWDIGGVSTALHPDTGLPTVFVHDGHPGGAGFAERGFDRVRTWLTATRDAIASCECATGCPSCVQSPKCGNGNDPLEKAAAIRTLDALLRHAPAAST